MMSQQNLPKGHWMDSYPSSPTRPFSKPLLCHRSWQWAALNRHGYFYRFHMQQLIIWYNWWMWKQVCKRKEERVILIMSPPSILGHFFIAHFFIGV